MLTAAEASGQVVVDCNRHEHRRRKQAEQLEAQSLLRFLDSARTRAVRTAESPTSGSGISHIETLAAIGLSARAGREVSQGFQAAARRKIDAWQSA